MKKIQGKSILVRYSARFELARVQVIGSQLYVIWDQFSGKCNSRVLHSISAHCGLKLRYVLFTDSLPSCRPDSALKVHARDWETEIDNTSFCDVSHYDNDRYLLLSKGKKYHKWVLLQSTQVLIEILEKPVLLWLQIVMSRRPWVMPKIAPRTTCNLCICWQPIPQPLFQQSSPPA